MKSRIFWSWGLGLGVATLLLAVGGSRREASIQATNTAPLLQPEADAETAVKAISPGKPLPSYIKPTGPISEVIKLADSGVDESVIMAFVANSTSPFNPGVEEIIYLNSIGVSGSVVTAMMQRDQALKELTANVAAVPAAPASVASANQFAPEPGTPTSYAPEPATAFAPPEMAPETLPPGDYTAEDYPPPPAADTGDSTFYDAPTPSGTGVDVASCGPGWPAVVVVVNRTAATGSTRTFSTVRSAPAPKAVAPLILHGPDRHGGVREAFPPNALVVIGRREVNPHRTARQSSAWTPEPPRSRPTAFSPDAFPRPAANQNPPPITTAAWATPARSEPAWSAPRPTEPPARSEPQRQYAAPSRNRR